MEVLEDYYPKWLKQNLIDNSFPWDKAAITTLPKFLEEYTLHDSGWIGLWVERNQEATAIIRWDEFWVADKIPELNPTTSQVAKWPILLIHFPQLFQFIFGSKQKDFSSNTIAEATSNHISSQEKEALLEQLIPRKGVGDYSLDFLLDEKLCHSSIIMVDWDVIHLWHAEEVQILCLDNAGTVISIPNLS